MRILILGFGDLARKILAELKKSPDYGEHKKFAASHVHVGRNSLSYGPDYVVEIPDPQGDGYRTYNDGLQAIDNYSTTVSDYEDHILGEIEQGRFSLIVDCMSITESSQELLAKVRDVAPNNCKFVLANREKTALDAVNRIKNELDIYEDHDLGELDPGLVEEGRVAWAAAKDKMERLHREKRAQYAQEHPEFEGRTAREYVLLENLIPEVDQVSIKRFVVDKQPYTIDYKRSETYSKTNKCLIVKHEMLDWFFGWHSMEGPACQIHGNPKLKLASAKYVEYDSDKAIPLPEEDYDYAVEYVVSGTLEVTSSNGGSAIIKENAAYAYRPKLNPPLRKVYNGLGSMIFYYKED